VEGSTLTTGLEIFDKLAYGHTLFHRDGDAWDLLDNQGMVVAVLCPRKTFVSVAPPESGRAERKPAGTRIPYGEKVAFRVDDSNLDDGIAKLQALL